MATKATTSDAGPVGTSVLEQLAELDVEDISPEVARKLLRVRFAPVHHRRVDLLSEKARDGALTPDEAEELDEYLRVGDLLAILQSRSRRALKDAGLPD
jgi:hypothetical protein